MGRFRQDGQADRDQKRNGRIAPGNAGKGQRKVIGLDRRSIKDRRRAVNLNYFADSGVERRKWKERRRQRVESRKGWVRVSEWTSAMVGFRFRPSPPRRTYRLEEGE